MNSTKAFWCAVAGLLVLADIGQNQFSFAKQGPDAAKERLAAGKELFTREWVAGDKRSHAGAGLGPVFNGRSCAECHNQGGVGGSGSQEVNAHVVSTFIISFVDRREIKEILGIPPGEAADPNNPLKQPDRARLAEIHPLLRTQNSFPLHRFGTSKEFASWRTSMLAKFAHSGGPGRQTDEEKAKWALHSLAGDSDRTLRMTELVDGVNMAFILSQRNTPALFGAGLIDGIPDSVLEEVAAEQARNSYFPVVASKWRSALPVTGRLPRLKDGRNGRFGWKSSVATLREFVLHASSSELGLEVPGFHRSVPPGNQVDHAPGVDMTLAECDQLVEFVAALPKPAARALEGSPDAIDQITAGQKLFLNCGCASCHRPKLGDVDGIYSDLLLHNMGQSLSDAGDYGTNLKIIPVPGNPNPLPVNHIPGQTNEKEEPPKFGAGALEWRTPPLWGLQDSGPYLHDGRAKDIEEAVRMHGGEGAEAEEAFSKLTRSQRGQIVLFLKSVPFGNEAQLEWKESSKLWPWLLRGIVFGAGLLSVWLVFRGLDALAKSCFPPAAN